MLSLLKLPVGPTNPTTGESLYPGCIFYYDLKYGIKYRYEYTRNDIVYYTCISNGVETLRKVGVVSLNKGFKIVK